MLLVKTELRKSAIHGFGVFAAEDIPKGTVIWTYQEGFDTVIPVSMLSSLPEVTQKFIKWYGYRDRNHLDGYVMCNDDSRFMNHTSPSNTDNTSDNDTVAAVDIKAGEEITCNYDEFYLADEGVWSPEKH